MEIETRRLADLKPADYNPRKKLEPGDPEYEKIARSIEEFGYCDPIIINRDGTIIGGHQRTQVLLDMGAETADCVVVDLDPDKEKALNIQQAAGRRTSPQVLFSGLTRRLNEYLYHDSGRRLGRYRL